jgi:hypothetical protein
MITEQKTMTSEEAWDLFEAHVKEEEKIPYENLTTDFSVLLRSNPRVSNSFKIGQYTVELSDCFHFLVARVVGLSDWFNYAVINTWDSRFTWSPDMIDFEGLDGVNYAINVEEKGLYKRIG